jgi:hypothetical protein
MNSQYYEFLSSANQNIANIIQFYREVNQNYLRSLNTNETSNVPRNTVNSQSSPINTERNSQNSNSANSFNVTNTTNAPFRINPPIVRTNRSAIPISQNTFNNAFSGLMNTLSPFLSNRDTRILFGTTLLGNNATNNSFFDPVPVRATNEQIEDATSIIDFSDLSNEQTECPIDQITFEEGDRILRINHCGHVFRENNIRLWLSSHVTCPICRHDIREITQNDESNAQDVSGNEENNDSELNSNNNNNNNVNNIESLLVNTLTNALNSTLNDISFNGNVDVQYDFFTPLEI